uniref:Uncharacterized protein n=2 Tax=Caenorhabditis japonica TaxID=281687 RepID=A0A8R1I5I8_CAEJA
MFACRFASPRLDDGHFASCVLFALLPNQTNPKMNLFVAALLLVVVVASGGPCRMSPLTTFLTEDQQKTLHQLIVSARTSGADEEMVKDSMDEYLAQVLSPQRLVEFKTAHDEFEAQRRGKRAVHEDEDGKKKEPKKVFDIIDQFTFSGEGYQKFYEESAAVRNRKL